MPDVHVVMLNWNSWADNIASMESLMCQEGVDLEFVIVDNASHDDSVDRILTRFPADQYPQVKLVRNEKNLGYPGGMNSGIRYALQNGAHRILLINNDIIAAPDMVRLLLDHLSDTVSITFPSIFYAEAPNVIWSVGGNINPLVLEMITPQGGHIPLPDNPVFRDFVSGCALLVKREVFEQIGLMDERFSPIYYEDLDFSFRVRKQGFKILLVPQAKLWHKVSQASGGEFSPRVCFLMGRNSGYYFRKHMRFWNIPFIGIYRLASAIKTSVRLLLKKNRSGLAAYWSGLANGWFGLAQNAADQILSFYVKRKTY